MISTVKQDLRRQIVFGYYDILRRTRKRIKGIKLGHLWTVEVLGCNPDGCTVSDLAKSEGIAPSSVCDRLKYAICCGLAYKDGRHYKLTDKGRDAFRILEEEFSAELEKIVSGILAEVRRCNK